MQKTLQGKIAIVTGGAQGLGAAICLRLAQEGAHVVIADMNLDGATQTAADIEAMRAELAAYTEVVTDFHTQWWQVKTVPQSELERYRTASDRVRQAIFDSTHNQVFAQLARPVLRLRNLRTWLDNPEHTLESTIALEVDFYSRVIDAIAGRNPTFAAKETARLMQLPTEAIEAMRQTPVGEIPQIPLVTPLKLG